MYEPCLKQLSNQNLVLKIFDQDMLVESVSVDLSCLLFPESNVKVSFAESIESFLVWVELEQIEDSLNRATSIGHWIGLASHVLVLKEKVESAKDHIVALQRRACESWPSL